MSKKLRIDAQILPDDFITDWTPFDPLSPPGEFSDESISRIPAGYRFVHGVAPGITNINTVQNTNTNALVLVFPNPFVEYTTIIFRGIENFENRHISFHLYTLLEAENY